MPEYRRSLIRGGTFFFTVVIYHWHLDYIHYNPVKHELVSSVADWRWSSFYRYMKLGYSAGDWGATFDEKKGAEAFGE